MSSFQNRATALAGSGAAGVHPDPDLSTAFAEKSPNDGERARVCSSRGMRHLPGGVVTRHPRYPAALSLGPERPRWLSWPVLRWGALVACVEVVSAAVTLHYEHREPMPSVAEKLPLRRRAQLQDEVPASLARSWRQIFLPSAAEFGGDFGAAGKLANNGQRTKTPG